MADQNARWLLSSANWKTAPPNGFKGKKILGTGSYGIAGLWSYEGPADQAPPVQHVVVKQCSKSEYSLIGTDPYIEGKLLEILSKIQSKHILRMYGSLVRAIGSDGQEDIRLFLEYCPGGDLSCLLESGHDKIEAPRKALLEIDIWAMFYCLALGVAAIARGTEDENAPAWNSNTEITHYDIKVDNIFLGYRDEDHPRYPILKIADFSTAVEEPRVSLQNDKTGYARVIAGDLSIRPPEADPESAPLKNPRKGTTSNIYQIGCIVHCLITLTTKDFRSKKGGLKGMLNSLKRGGETQGADLDKREFKNLYSKTLRELVMRCMMREPLQRPGALKLQIEVRKGFEAATAAAKKSNVFKDGGLTSIPMVGTAWPEPPTLMKTI
ncbi:kinase-like protein [Mollisia scopiformis]|uniref:non-specific serine/threonine protein kinase n=1 Tax=Mollisia scopiformis TaxID=149040 RepID=A0A194XBJ2_MOLSC|nr:kinase-like protein [Mollisia scopiformis]KUJ17529.1 kinase-like protein [Mollisia scopiformis]